MVEPAFADLAERHDLDQRQIHAAAVRPLHQVGEFVLVDALERDGVDLDLQAGGLRSVDPGEHLAEIAPARDRAEFIGVERVERNVDALDAVRPELGGVFGQLRAVGRQREFVERAGANMTRQRADQRHDAPPHQRFAAGEPKLAHAPRDESRAQPVEFLERQQIGLRQETHVLRHAIDAAEIAPVGDRDPQIGDGAAERIDQRQPIIRAAIKVGRLHAVHKVVRGHSLAGLRPFVVSSQIVTNCAGINPRGPEPAFHLPAL